MEASSPLSQAIQAIQSGDKAAAQRLLTQLLAAEPNNDQAWLWLAACLSAPEKQRYCLQKALAIRPDNPQARQALEQLEARLAFSGAPAAPAHQAQSPEAVQEMPTSPLQESESPDQESDTGGESSAPLAAPSPAQPETSGKAAKAPARANPRSSLRKKSPTFSSAQLIFLFLLGLVAIFALLGLAYIAIQSGAILPPISAGNPVTPTGAQPAARTPFELPPTWTSTAAPLVTATQPLAGRSVPSPVLPSPTPLPSLTPYAHQWRIVSGYSVKKRPIEIFRFGTGKNERMIVAGIHGAYEKNTVALADRLIEYLQKNPDFIPKDATLYILRSLNPDGETASNAEDGRLNANGVDLNRNFGVNWKSSWQDGDCASPSGTAGAAPASEPETKAFMNFIAGRQVEVLISYHSAGLGIFPSGNPPQPESQRLAQDIAAISNYPYPAVKTGCEYTGTLVDWAAQNGVIAAVDLELSNHQDSEFETNLKVLRLLLEWQPAPRTPTPVTPSPEAKTPLATTPSATLGTGTPSLVTLAPTVVETQAPTPSSTITAPFPPSATP